MDGGSEAYSGVTLGCFSSYVFHVAFAHFVMDVYHTFNHCAYSPRYDQFLLCCFYILQTCIDLWQHQSLVSATE